MCVPSALSYLLLTRLNLCSSSALMMIPSSLSVSGGGAEAEAAAAAALSSG